MHDVLNFINGEFRPAKSGAFIDNVEPATGKVYGRVASSSKDDVDAAVNAAKAAFPAWSATPTAERARILIKLADLIESNAERFARAESIDSGKPVALARAMDIPRGSANLRYFAGLVQHTSSDFFDHDGSGVPAFNYTLRKPRGVAGIISPWNLPLYLFTWKIAPALATGNTVVGKPSEVTPVTAAMLGELCEEAGLPRGVLNIVQGLGTDCGGAIVQHPDVPAISFTGSTKVGQWIAQHAGPMFKRVSLELGGKNPFIVFDDADFTKALDTAARAAFSNQGQICLCGSRVLVHESRFKDFVAALADRARALRVGDPLEATTQQGALTSRPHFEKVASMVKTAKDLGGVIHAGGEPVSPSELPDRCRGGFFYRPTVISGLDPACSVEQEEIFGPVVTVQPFKDEAHAIALANGTKYGLSATIFSNDVTRAHRVAAAVDAGVVWVNCWLVRDLRTPFGGSRASGVGREGGTEATKFFTEPKNVCVSM